ncbi:MAG TPA: GNAT family N-acetyltransferase [Ignavibacteria bacterium]|jgi:ribosomal protein S18 acetylase RimI-like enzyme
MNIRIKKLSEKYKTDFFRIHSGDDRWCNCTAWWVKTWDGWGDRTAEENLMLREELFDKGEYDGYLLYIDNTPIGWCQCVKRDRLEKLTNQFNLTPSPDAWAITCFLIKPQFRKQGLSQKFLDLILNDLEKNGIKHVQAFPKCGFNLPDGEVWTGPENIYLKAGFVSETDNKTSLPYGLKF